MSDNSHNETEILNQHNTEVRATQQLATINHLVGGATELLQSIEVVYLAGRVGTHRPLLLLLLLWGRRWSRTIFELQIGLEVVRRQAGRAREGLLQRDEVAAHGLHHSRREVLGTAAAHTAGGAPSAAKGGAAEAVLAGSPGAAAATALAGGVALRLLLGGPLREDLRGVVLPHLGGEHVTEAEELARSDPLAVSTLTKQSNHPSNCKSHAVVAITTRSHLFEVLCGVRIP